MSHWLVCQNLMTWAVPSCCWTEQLYQGGKKNGTKDLASITSSGKDTTNPAFHPRFQSTAVVWNYNRINVVSQSSKTNNCKLRDDDDDAAYLLGKTKIVYLLWTNLSNNEPSCRTMSSACRDTDCLSVGCSVFASIFGECEISGLRARTSISWSQQTVKIRYCLPIGRDGLHFIPFDDFLVVT